MTQANQEICPCCDGQGLIKHILVKPLNLEGYLCDECNAFWLKKEDISEEVFLEYGPYVKEKGLKGDVSEVVHLD